MRILYAHTLIVTNVCSPSGLRQAYYINPTAVGIDCLSDPEYVLPRSPPGRAPPSIIIEACTGYSRVGWINERMRLETSFYVAISSVLKFRFQAIGLIILVSIIRW
jgi:hypothetical protein